jgi:3-hydroxyisobutyrate dehydrogenase-like beta-hydroxyacid dehydrogenase
MSQSVDSIGFIGLGSMGLPMARNLLDAGFKLKVFNRTKSKAEELIPLGVEVVDSSAAVAASDGIVVTMVANDAVLNEIVTGEDGIGNVLGQNGIHLSMFHSRSAKPPFAILALVWQNSLTPTVSMSPV